MEKINLCEGVVAQMMDTEAWGNVSGDFPFSEAQLEKYADKLDWKEIGTLMAIADRDTKGEYFLERPDVGEVQEKNRLDGPVPLPAGGERFG